MPDKLGRLFILLSILSVVAGSEVSAQVVSGTTTAGSTSDRLVSHQLLFARFVPFAFRDRAQLETQFESERTLVPAVDRQDGPHDASDVSQSFTKHLDRNVPAMLLITLVRSPLPLIDTLKHPVQHCSMSVSECRSEPCPLQLEQEEAPCLCPYATHC